MSEDERRAWDDRYGSGEYQPRPAPGPFLEAWIDRFPAGRALDVACGAGRHALRLAEAGYQVDAIDVSAVAIEMGREEAERRGLEVNWVVADLDDFPLAADTYDVIIVIRYVNPRLWPRLLDALAPDGWLLVEHHLRTTADVDGPGSPEFRLDPQELIEAFGSLRILFYEEALVPSDRPGSQFALARLVATAGRPDWEIRS
jgi:SAM-dependent methyltransferase